MASTRPQARKHVSEGEHTEAATEAVRVGYSVSARAVGNENDMVEQDDIIELVERPEPQVPGELRTLRGAVDEFDETLGLLISRLSPVLTPRPDGAIDPESDARIKWRSPVAEAIWTQRSRLEEIRAVLSDVLDRLEV